jgi:MFS transporter, ACS family, hexuronate transporter
MFATSVGNWAAVFLIGLAGSAHQAWSASLYSTASDMFPKHAVASLIGLGSAAGSTAGMIFPIVTGLLLDKFTAQGNVTGGYTVLFLICAFAYLVAFVLNHLCAPRFEELSALELEER